MKKGVMMKEIFKNGTSIFLRFIAVNVMSFIIIISLGMLFTSFFTENIGYKVLGTASDSTEQVELYTHYNSDGEDLKKSEFEEQGYTITQINIRSPLSSAGNISLLVIIQIFCFVLLISFTYSKIWSLGDSDSNLVKFKHKKEDILKGLKIGLVALIPYSLAFIALIVAKMGVYENFSLDLYKFINSVFYSVNVVIIGSSATLGELSSWRLVLLFAVQLFVPIICMVAYILGYRNFSITENIVYKKK